MQVEQLKWTAEGAWIFHKENTFQKEVQLVLAFGQREIIQENRHFDYLRERYPNANIIMSSISGEILSTSVSDYSIVVSALYFEKTAIRVSQAQLLQTADSYDAGKKMAMDLDAEDLVHILVISDGLVINGGELVRGLNENISKNIPITGGLAGDNARFEYTAIGLNEVPKEGSVIAVGFYGDKLKVGYGSMGGWSVFGPERIITKSDANVLYELDNQSALQLYKMYLGDQVKELPSSALLFPLGIRSSVTGEHIVRTILSIDEAKQTMSFAGNMPEGSRAQLMYANFNKLLDGGILAANNRLIVNEEAEFALLISCVGRKLVLKNRVEEEVEEVKLVLGESVPMCGFYSNGEISPLIASPVCELFNQTMTITTYTEID